jgi:soluble lytic murein transglycosylase
LAYADNAQLSYQLALYFRDLGLYRSSILAAVAVLTRAGVTVYEAPPLVGRLAYPTYYSDLVVPHAEKYGYDPLLHFALLRQESLFEGFATSTAMAQGLGQVIPATGEYIALKLGWPNYVNEDLYRPSVNLAFAAFYLDEQLRGFGGNKAAALAAYNAGPGNAIRWRNQAGDNHDLYLETVNFNETRLYIRNIYIWHAAYRHLYGAE